MLFRLWRVMQRRLDLTILWVELKGQAADIDHAKAAFFYHVINDTAWTTDFTKEELIEIVDALT